MNHDPFKINEAVLDLWRDLKAGEDYIHRLEIRNAALVKQNDILKQKVERIVQAGDAIDEAFSEHPISLNRVVEMLRRWKACKQDKDS